MHRKYSIQISHKYYNINNKTHKYYPYKIIHYLSVDLLAILLRLVSSKLLIVFIVGSKDILFRMGSTKRKIGREKASRARKARRARKGGRSVEIVRSIMEVRLFRNLGILNVMQVILTAMPVILIYMGRLTVYKGKLMKKIYRE